MKCCTPKCSIITVTVFSILCIGSGLFLFFVPDLIDSVVTVESQLSTSSISYSLWQHIPVPVYRQFYVFNYTNWEKFSSGEDSKPVVQEIGPYTYQEIRNKVFLDWESNGDYVQYRETHNFIFRPDLSPNLSEDDWIFSPNLPLVSTCDLISRMFPPEQQSAVYTIIGLAAEKAGQKAFVNMTVGELLFYGYHDPVLQFAQDATQQEFLPGSYYAMFYGINATDDGKYEINRGYQDIKQLYHIRKWNESTGINLWSMDKPDGNLTGCNMYNGTDGSFYWPGIERKDKVTIFISSVCRSVFMEYLEDMSFQGIDGYRYASTIALFADPNMNPDNYCFCSPNSTACIASGVAALGPCKFGAPIYISHPHFLYTDIGIADAIVGMKPDESQHRIVVSIEPKSGNLIRIDVRFQISLRMFNVQEIEALKYIPPTTLLPLVWINESSQLDNERVNLIHDSLYVPENVVYAIAYTLISLTGFMICVGVACAYNLMFRFRKFTIHGVLQPSQESPMFHENTINIPRPKQSGPSGYSNKAYSEKGSYY